MKYLKYILLAVCGLGITACGGGGGGGNANTNNATQNRALTSQLCSQLSGIEAVYWDFINGVPRGDLPSTAFTIPFNLNPNQPIYQNSTSLLLGFSVPDGWTAFDGVDFSGFAIPGTVAKADLIRNDNGAIWSYTINGQIQGNFTADSILSSEINNAFSFLINPGPATAQCEINLQQHGIIGPESVAAKIVRMGGITVMARVHVIVVPGVSAYYTSFLSAGSDAEYPALINDIYVPMITQLLGSGSSFNNDKACSDGKDNDGDGAIDFPSDPQCTNPSDDSESSN